MRVPATKTRGRMTMAVVAALVLGAGACGIDDRLVVGPGSPGKRAGEVRLGTCDSGQTPYSFEVEATDLAQATAGDVFEGAIGIDPLEFIELPESMGNPLRGPVGSANTEHVESALAC
jgi:hypothetical protein